MCNSAAPEKHFVFLLALFTIEVVKFQSSGLQAIDIYASSES